MTALPDLRIQLAEARIALSKARDTEKIARAAAEHHAIASLNGSAGRNAEERERNLILALDKDEEYQRMLSMLRQREAAVERLEAQLEAARDVRRADEWRIRAKLADALWRNGVQSDEADPAGDAAWDDTSDSYATSPSRAQAYETIPDYDLPF